MNNANQASSDVCTFTVLVDGNELPNDLHLFALTVSHELNRIPSASLQIRDGEAAQASFSASNSAHFVPGKRIEIQLGYRAQNSTVFTGIIVKHSVRLRKNGSVLQVECRAQALRMSHHSISRYFSASTDSAIMEELIQAHQLRAQVSATQTALPELVQYAASDWDFLLCRAEANGQVVVVDDDQIRIAAPDLNAAASLQLQYGSNLLELDAEIDARVQSSSINAISWSASEQAIISAQAVEPTLQNSGNLSARSLASAIDEEEQQLRHGGRISQAELQIWADARLLKERLAKVRGRAKLQGTAAIRPDQMIELQGVGERFNGLLYVSGVRHSLSNGNWETDVQFGLSPELFAETYSLQPTAASGLLPPISGLQLGIVTALENDPEAEQRIKVRLPLISTEEEGIWARLATLDAGDQRGTFFRPEINDEVVLGFLNDDPRHPVILGMCHSSAKPAPEPAQDRNHRKGYVSRAGLRLNFDDEYKNIVLETPAGNRLSLSEKDSSLLIEDQNGNRVVLDQNGISLSSSKDLKLNAQGDIQISGLNLDIKTELALKAMAKTNAELSGTSTTLKGSATAVIQGGLVQIN